MGGEDVRNALARIAEFFAQRETRAGVVARRHLHAAGPKDTDLADHLVREIRRRTRLDGSMGGSLVATAWAAWELMDLGCVADCAALVRMVGYLLARQDGPGHFAEGCSEERHREQRCHHFLHGFFSPGARDAELAPLTFPLGVTIAEEEDTRFAASCFALRTVLRAGEDRREGIRNHVSSLADAAFFRDAWSPDTDPNLFFFALGALIHGPMANRPRLTELLAEALAHQGADGTWPNAHLFHALDMLSGATGPEVRRTALRVAPLLCAMQQPSGAFDPTDHEEPALVAMRILLLAGGTSA
jgi:hypothetical protein